MRFLLLSDLHSNDEALTAVLSRVKRKKFDRVVCLGDFVGYAADPNKVLDRMRMLHRTGLSIRGNHDKVVSGVDGGDMFNPPALYAARWTAERLSKENSEFLRRLPLGPLVIDGASGNLVTSPNGSVPEGSFVACHGSPMDEDAYIFSDFDASMNFVQMHRIHPDLALCFFGHSHIPSVFTLEASGIRVEAVRGPRARLKLEPDKRYLINPGSVGQPRDRNPKASYAIYDAVERVVHFDRVPYDVQSARKKIHRAGLPAVLGDRLVVGL